MAPRRTSVEERSLTSDWEARIIKSNKNLKAPNHSILVLDDAERDF